VSPSWKNFKAAVLAIAAVCVPMCVPASALATMVRIDTAKGPIDIELFDTAAPLTVTNFLNYVRRGAYDNSFFHRLAAGFVVQGGGFSFGTAVSKIVADPPVQNEFSLTRSNLRGTVAMAKVGGNPNSATSEWFVNLANNASNLDTQNGGFTVFGRVTKPGMVTFDAIAALSVVNASGCGVGYSPLDTLPLYTRITTCAEINRNTLVMVNSARELPAVATLSDTDRVLNYLEASYPQYVAPSSPATLNAAGYVYRFYAKTNAYVGSKDGNVYYLVPAISPDIQLLASVADLLGQAVAAGY
jgi:peptidyl-prolyl cis-trans isomerase A (cyclophilin A)